MMKALIVDDEYPAREEIRFHLSRHEDIQVVGEAASTAEAMALISALNYDVVFMDINFPVDNGIELGKAVSQRDKVPLIVYVTAYDQYAVDAFEVRATDYVLKPIDGEKFDRSIEQIRRLFDLKKENALEALGGESEHDDFGSVGIGSKGMKRISAEQNGKIHLVDADEIYYAFIDQNYVMIKRRQDTLYTRYNITSLEEKLKDYNFFRTTRSHLVNLNKVKEITPFFKGRCLLVMSDDNASEVPVSRRQAKELKKIFDF